jgi:PAS domain S-box-containing protein
VKPAKLEILRALQTTGLLILFVGLYFLGGKLGLKLAFLQSSATAVWPPAGLALAALLIFGYRLWPGVFIGAFLVNITTAGNVLTSLFFATGNTLEAVVGAYLINRFANGIGAFEKPSTFLRFVFLGPFVSAAISATIGVTTLTVAGLSAPQQYGVVWLTWWLGDAVSLLVLTPFLALWFLTPPPSWQWKKVLEFIAVLAVAFGISIIIFGGFLPMRLIHHPFSFALLPVMLWVAFRFSARETATVTLLICGVALWGTLKGFGPFALPLPNESLVVLQGFIGIAATTAYLTSSTVGESHRAINALTELETHHRALFDVSPEAILISRRNTVSFANAACVKLFGASSSNQLVGKLTLDLFHPSSQDAIRTDLERLAKRGGRSEPRMVEVLRLRGHSISAEMTATGFVEHDSPSVHILLRRFKV